MKGFLLTIPVLILVIIFGVIPFAQATQLAFFDAGLRHKEFVGFKNFIHIFKLDAMKAAFRNTAGYAVVTVPLSTLVALFIALCAGNMKQAGFVRISFYSPNLVAAVIMAGVWQWIFSSNGLINGTLRWMGFKNISWFGSMPEAFIMICIIMIMGGLGLSVLIYMAAMSQIQKELYEYARIEGANGLQQAWYISLPILLPITSFLLITKTVGSFQTWQTVWLLTQGGPIFGTTTLVYQLYRYVLYEDKLGLGSAVGMVIMVMIGSLMAVQIIALRKRLKA